MELLIFTVVLLVIGIPIVLWYKYSEASERLARLERKVGQLSEQISTLKEQSELSDKPSIADLQISSEQRPLAEPIEAEPAPTPAYSEPVVQATESEIDLSSIPPSSSKAIASTSDQHINQEKAPNPILEWLLKGNVMLKLGAVILFLGLGFLLKFASEHIHFSVQNRYISVAVLGAVGTYLGWRLRHKRAEYGLVLQGLGIGVLYLTSLASLKLHALLPTQLVFVVQVALVALMVLLAVLQNAQILAQVALLGGLASPVLLSDGSGNHLVLFSYLALLNSGVATVAWFKRWRLLNLTSFIGTSLLVSAWGWKSYQPEFYALCQTFLVYYLVLYSLIVWRFALLQRQTEQPPRVANNASLEQLWQYWVQGVRQIGVLDSALLFGSATSAFVWQVEISEQFYDAFRHSALVFMLFYGVFAWVVHKQKNLHLLYQALLALTALFASLALLSGFEQTGLKALMLAFEAGLVYYFGMRQASPLARLSAFVLLGLSYAFSTYSYAHEQPYLQGGLIAVVSLVICALWQKNYQKTSALWEKAYAMIAFSAGLLLILWQPIYAVQKALISSEWACVLLAGFALLCSRECYFSFVRVKLALSSLFLWTSLIYYAESLDSVALRLFLCAVAFMLAWWQDHIALATHKPKWLPVLSGISFAIGLKLLYETLDSVIHLSSEGNEILAISLCIFALILLIEPHLHWKKLRAVLALFLPLMLILLLRIDNVASFTLPQFSSVYTLSLPLSEDWLWQWGGLSVLALLVHIGILWRYAQAKWISHSHWAGFNLFLAQFSLLSFLLAKQAELAQQWLYLSGVVVPLFVLALLQKCRAYLEHKAFAFAYLRQGLIPTLAYFVMWLIIANIGNNAELNGYYVPFFNPIEASSLAILALLWLHARREGFLRPWLKNIQIGLAVGVWLMLNLMMLRIWHHYFQVEWQWQALLKSFGLQAGLSVLWTLCAIGLMLKGNQWQQRQLWLAGAGLIGVVVLKLFLVELADRGGVARIASFIIVGLLLLIVGYFAPMPKAEQKEELEKEERDQM